MAVVTLRDPFFGGGQMKIPRRFIALSGAAFILLAACGTSSGGGLASKQILRFPVFQDPKTFDPGQADAEVDTELCQNVFDNLWIYNSQDLSPQPDIASEVPTAANGGISADGMTYTIKLKHNVKFSNGDPVTAKDVLYSFNRAAALGGPYASSLSATTGFSAVNKAGKALGKPKKGAAETERTNFQTKIENALAAKDPTLQMSGLTAPDGPNGYTVQMKLSAAAGWVLSALTLQCSVGSIVDENVIKADPRDWWSKPSELVGTGAFKLDSYTPKQSLIWKAVSAWWGSPQPTLTEVDNDIKDPSTQSTSIAAWEQNSYDIVGYGGNSSLPVADVLRIHGNSKESSQLLLHPKGRTTWVSPNVGYPATGGPFVDQAGPTASISYSGQTTGISLDKASGAAHDLRLAFDLAIDKDKLAKDVCHNLTCQPATGGLITKGLIGYLGDGADPLAKFDPGKAKSLLTSADPDGSKTKNLKYSFNTGGLNDPVATFLQDQWKTNLGVSVNLDPQPDASAFIANRSVGKYVMSRDGWQFDYNHPQDWFDNLWGTVATQGDSNASGYASKTYDDTLAKADAESLDLALPLYKQLLKELSDNVAYYPLYYQVGQFLIHDYVKGAGSNTQLDYYWDGISLQQH
jgi:oligopeptide transport system substrate-binding protein